MIRNKERIQPEFKPLDSMGGTSIRYFEQDKPATQDNCLHYHDDYELHLTTHGEGRVFVGDYMGHFAPQSLILIGPNLPHCWVNQSGDNDDQGCTERIINFSPELVSAHTKGVPEMQALTPFWERAQYGIEFLDVDAIARIQQIFDDIAALSGFRRVLRFWFLIDLLAAVAEYRVLSDAAYLSCKDDTKSARLDQAVAYIMENYNTGITLEQVAAHIDMSVGHFSRLFKRETGCRYIDFVNGIKINKACEQLTHSDRSITEICFAVGFNNIANFNRRFYDVKKMTPSEYRRVALKSLYGYKSFSGGRGLLVSQ
ncbi:helix-turn-helix domain-containing protein [Amphritea pacifica]|uniref:helix-turn-helix domain-containing protein n=1 Tax=Amphritea pacifica TaxID=2811233 RepID=UPI001E55A0FF|nr:AraC family transcriptional regulator [Amphritea pacifica]